MFWTLMSIEAFLLLLCFSKRIGGVRIFWIREFAFPINLFRHYKVSWKRHVPFPDSLSFVFMTSGVRR